MHKLFGGKEAVFCAVCHKELGRHRYRPEKDWNIKGHLCSDCHIEKTKEFMLRQQELQDAPDHCTICGKEISLDNDRNKPRWQWEMESGSLVCKACYQKKDSDYNKKVNFCASCNGRLGLLYYHPKPAWKIEGNLCRQCWDDRNGRGR